MLKTRYSVSGSSMRPLTGSPAVNLTAGRAAPFAGSPDRLTANFGASLGGAPVQLMSTGGVTWNRFLTGIMPEDDQGLITYYRDCYSFDSVAGATVDMQSTFPFSDFTLVGLEVEETQIFTDTCAKMNVRSLMAEVSINYMVDGAFVGSLIHDPRTNTFKDIMIHDWAAATLTPSPFYAADSDITIQASPKFQAYVNSPSPYVQAILNQYPKGLVDSFRAGSVTLDPLTTIFIPRRGTQEQRTTSYLRRVLPAYLLEKTMYRGTLIEAQKRMRATSHITVGTDTWEPTPAEMMAVMGQFQMSEADPLGAWVVTRQGVQVQDIRTAGDFWKWTDLIDTLVPYKLRALGVSEAFLSGEAAFATAETAMTVFTENAGALREYLTNKFFHEKLFPLIAVTNKRYRDASKAEKGDSIAAFLANVSNQKNLRIPSVRWHKTLDNHDPGMMDLLNTLGEKGIPVPLKMWAAAANVSLDMLLGDLREDEKIKDAIAEITGIKPDSTINQGDEGSDGMDFEGGSGLPYSNKFHQRKVPLLSRKFEFADGTPMDTPVRMSKSGNKVHAVYNEKASKAATAEMIYRAAMRLRDPQYAATARARVISKIGHMPSLHSGI